MEFQCGTASQVTGVLSLQVLDFSYQVGSYPRPQSSLRGGEDPLHPEDDECVARGPVPRQLIRGVGCRGRSGLTRRAPPSWAGDKDSSLRCAGPPETRTPGREGRESRQRGRGSSSQLNIYLKIPSPSFGLDWKFWEGRATSAFAAMFPADGNVPGTHYAF